MTNHKEIYNITNKIIIDIDSDTNLSNKRQTLAKLRNSIGKDISESIEVWPILFKYLPEELLGDNRGPSYAEKSILVSLQLYALHQQAKTEVVFETKDRFNNIGNSMKQMRTQESNNAIDNRFNAMLIANNFEEISNHLRHLIKLLRAKSPETKVNYGRLSEDLFCFLIGYKKNLRLNWARQYYWIENKGAENND